MKLPTVARECDRRGISDRAAAAISSAILQDLGLIDHNDQSSVVDRSKIRREREKLRKSLSTKDTSSDLGIGLYFDGRKDLTYVLERRVYSAKTKIGIWMCV